ncbi:MAG: hypothetical protein ABI220_04500 [Candidatus Saccharimonadales bacterium]
MANQPKQQDGIWRVAGLAMAGCIVIGTGVGQLVDRTGTWSTVGLGVGLLVMALFLFINKK